MMMWAGVSLSKRRIYRPLPVPIVIDRRHDQQPDNEPVGQADIFPVHAVPLFRFVLFGTQASVSSRQVYNRPSTACCMGQAGT